MQFIPSRRLYIPFYIMILLLAIIFTGCLGGYGGYRTSSEVDRLFSTYQVLSDHTYYYTGSDTRPGAILTIHNDYTLTSADLWNRKAVTADDLRYWVSAMTSNLSNLPFGYYIVDPDGRRLGVFYATWDRGAVEMTGDRQVAVHLPTRIEDARPRSNR